MASKHKQLWPEWSWERCVSLARVLCCLSEPLPLLFSASCLLALVWAIPAIEISCSSNPLISVSLGLPPRAASATAPTAATGYCWACIFFFLLWIRAAPLRRARATVKRHPPQHVELNILPVGHCNIDLEPRMIFYLDHFPEKMVLFFLSQPESTSVGAKRSKNENPRMWGLELGCHDNSVLRAAYNKSAMQCRLLKIIDYLDVGDACGGVRWLTLVELWWAAGDTSGSSLSRWRKE